MDLDQSDDSMYPVPGSPPDHISDSSSIGHGLSRHISCQLAWDEYQRARQSAEVQTENEFHSIDKAQPPDTESALTILDITHAENDNGYDGDVEHVYPDAYESPGESKSKAKSKQLWIKGPRHEQQELPNDVISQSGILDHLETLDCNSSANDSPRRRSWLKGRKRRSRATEYGKHVRRRGDSAASSDFDANDLFDDEGRFSPKRIRRRSRNLHQKMWTAAASTEYRGISREDWQRPGDRNGVNVSMQTSEMGRIRNGDEMDID